jgi:hypothetical protein
LGKEEWKSVLKLSTIWNMEKVCRNSVVSLMSKSTNARHFIRKIRKYAIHRLSTDLVLSPIEKIHLARAHKVAAWIQEGITGLVNSDPKPTFNDFAQLEWETAARILWIKNNFLMAANTLHFRRDEIKCGSCSSSASLINQDYSCDYCGKEVPAYAELTVPDPGTASGPADHLVLLRAILCSDIDCRQVIFHSISVRCSSCLFYHDRNDNVRITPKKGLKEFIEEMFGDEISNYEVA